MTTTTLTPFQTAPRIHHSLTAAIERRTLHFLAARTPKAITPDHLTLLGFLAQLAAGASFALARTHPLALLAVVVCIALNWLGDSLDGTLARHRRHERPRFGFYADHIADIFGTAALLAGLAASGFIHPAIAAAVLIAFLILAAESFLATYTLGRFHLSQGPFGPTELRILLAAGTLALLRSPFAHIHGHTLLLFDLGGSIAAASMLTLAITLAVRHTAQLYQQERTA